MILTVPTTAQESLNNPNLFYAPGAKHQHQIERRLAVLKFQRNKKIVPIFLSGFKV